MSRVLVSIFDILFELRKHTPIPAAGYRYTSLRFSAHKGSKASFRFPLLATTSQRLSPLRGESLGSEPTASSHEESPSFDGLLSWLTLVDELSNYFEQSTEVETLSTCCSSMLAGIDPPEALASEKSVAQCRVLCDDPDALGTS